MAELFTSSLGKDVKYFAIAPEDYERALAQNFGPTVAFEIVEQFRWMAKQPNAVVDMSATAKRFSVELTPLAQWIKTQDWSAPA